MRIALVGLPGGAALVASELRSEAVADRSGPVLLRSRLLFDSGQKGGVPAGADGGAESIAYQSMLGSGEIILIWRFPADGESVGLLTDATACKARSAGEYVAFSI